MRSIGRRQFLRGGALILSGTALGPLLAACQAPAQPTPAPAQPTSTPAPAPTPTPAAAPTPTAVPSPTPAAKAAPAPSGPVTLQLWHDNWGELYNKLMTRIGDDFTKENPTITVKWTFNENNRDKLLTAFAAGVGPDIAEITVWGGQHAAFLANGLFRVLDDFWKDAGITDDKFIPAFPKIVRWKGKVMMQPGGADYLAMWYSRDLYRAAGIAGEAKTWDEFADHCVRLTRKDNAGNIQQFGWNPGGLNQLAMSFGGGWMSEDGTRITATREENLRAAEWLALLAKKVDASKIRNFTSGQPGPFQPGNPFATGKQGIVWDGFWFYEALDKYAPKLDYGVYPQPTVGGRPEEKKNYVIGGWGWGISSQTKFPEAAWAVTKYAMYDRAAQMGADTLNWPTVLASWPAFKERLFKNLPENHRYRPFHGIFEEGYRVGEKFFPVHVIGPKYSDEIDRVSDEIVLGKTTPKEALERLQKTMEAELAKASG